MPKVVEVVVVFGLIRHFFFFTGYGIISVLGAIEKNGGAGSGGRIAIYTSLDNEFPGVYAYIGLKCFRIIVMLRKLRILVAC